MFTRVGDLKQCHRLVPRGLFQVFWELSYCWAEQRSHIRCYLSSTDLGVCELIKDHNAE